MKLEYDVGYVEDREQPRIAIANQIQILGHARDLRIPDIGSVQRRKQIYSIISDMIDTP